MAALDIAHLRTWVGRESVSAQVLDLFPARALAALLDHEDVPQAGDALPLPWHWLYFLETPRRSGVGIDGHPARGGFLPPVPLPRRMWAGGSLRRHASLRLGEPARKVSTVRSVEAKDGKSGPLVFVRIEHALHQGDRLCILEEQDLVYREAPEAASPLPAGERAPEHADWSRTLRPDPPLLFRYSALTYNGHRIHYDRDYATTQEFYPALVVHGPLLATLLLDLLLAERPQAAVASFRYRGLRPAFDTDAVRLAAQVNGADVRLWAADPNGFVCMSASAETT